MLFIFLKAATKKIVQKIQKKKRQELKWYIKKQDKRRQYWRRRGATKS